MSREVVESRPGHHVSSSRESMISTIVLLLMMIVVIGAGLYLGWLWLVDHAPLFWAANSGWLLPTIIIVVLGGSAPWTVPLCWRVFKAVSSYIEDLKDREENRQLLISAWMAAEDGRAVKMVNGRTGDVVEIGPAPLPGRIAITEEKGQEKVQSSGVPLISPPQLLPGPMLMLDVIKRRDLHPENLFLAFGKGMKEIACSIDGFMHVAHDAPTGGGKTSQFYAEIAQLVKMGIRVLLANPHFTPHGKKAEEDWRPLARAIEDQGMITVSPGLSLHGLIRAYLKIVAVLKWLSEEEIDRRFRLREQGIYNYQPIYLFIDEWPAIVRRHPEAAEYLVDVLQRGRAVDVFVNVNAQGFLQTDVDLKGSARENFNTAYHMGGSVHSGAKLLDVTVKSLNELLRVEQVVLGRGIGLLRNNQASPEAQLVRLPYAEKQFFQYLFGPADDYVLPEYRGQYTQDRAEFYGLPTVPLREQKAEYVSTSGNAGNTVETPVETASRERSPKIIDDVFPASLDEEDLSVGGENSAVSAEVRETIRRMKQGNEKDRKISKYVGLAGRKYGVYQQVCRELGFATEKAEGE